MSVLAAEMGRYGQQQQIDAWVTAYSFMFMLVNGTLSKRFNVGLSFEACELQLGAVTGTVSLHAAKFFD